MLTTDSDPDLSPELTELSRSVVRCGDNWWSRWNWKEISCVKQGGRQAMMHVGVQVWCSVVCTDCTHHTTLIHWHRHIPPSTTCHSHPTDVICASSSLTVLVDNHIGGRSLPLSCCTTLIFSEILPYKIVIISLVLALYLASSFSEDLTFSVSSVTTWIQRTSVWKSIYF